MMQKKIHAAPTIVYPEFVNDRLPSAVLGLELGERDDELRLYNPDTLQWLQTPEERAENAEIHAQQETRARQNAETELARALVELERLRTEKLEKNT